jgi:ubiquinone biosynthesis protein UbiJ
LRITVGDHWDFRASIGATGLLQPCDVAVVPDVTLSVPADRLRDAPGVWRAQGWVGVTGLTHIQGDAGLAHVLSDLARSLRWDVEDDLSRVVGDVMAVRLLAGTRRVAADARGALRRAADNVGEYLGDESGLAVRSATFRDWVGRRQALADRLDGLESRLRRLEQAC